MMKVWVLISENLCMGVFSTRSVAEEAADMIIGPPSYGDAWDGDWFKTDEDDTHVTRNTTVGMPFTLEEWEVQP
jgi:hypothetical protein